MTTPTSPQTALQTRPETGLRAVADAAPVRELSDTDTGVWQILTETSTYVLDLDNRTAVRHPGNGGGYVDGLPDPITANLRLDDEVMPLLGVAACQVDRRAVFILDVRGDGIETVRQTTFVRAIHPLTRP